MSYLIYGIRGEEERNKKYRISLGVHQHKENVAKTHSGKLFVHKWEILFFAVYWDGVGGHCIKGDEPYTGM